MKSKDELKKRLFAILAELESEIGTDQVRSRLKIQLELLYDILGEDVEEEYWEQIEEQLM